MARRKGIKRDGDGFQIRVSAIDQRTGKLRVRIRVVRGVGLAEAERLQGEWYEEIRTGGQAQLQERVRFGAHVKSWLERIRRGIGTRTRAPLGPNTALRYADALDHHILPAFGDFFVDAISSTEIEDWMAKERTRPGRAECRSCGKLLPAHVLEDCQRLDIWNPPVVVSPATVNGWWRVLRTVLRDAVKRLKLPADPTLGVMPLPETGYTEEQPNSLTPDELRAFLAAVQKMVPQWLELLTLGFAIGARPGELRPIRWDSDLNMTTGNLVLRRSERRGHVGPTKTKKIRAVLLPAELLAMLAALRRRQIAEQWPNPMGLVFPSRVTGGYLSPSALDKPFAEVAASIGLAKRITPRAMRRTWNDVARLAGVDPVVKRTITGWATEEMEGHYATVGKPETRDAIAKVIDFVGAR